MPRVTNNPPSNTTRTPGGRNVIRPLYGVFIRDQVAGIRSGIEGTVDTLKKGIEKGSMSAKEVRGDGKLQGLELKSAKAAVYDLQKAIDALAPVTGGNPGPILNPIRGGGAGISGTTGSRGGSPIALYGVVLRDDLAKYRSEINSNIMTIQAGINSGQLKGTAKKEAQAAVKALKVALGDLANVGAIIG